MSVVSDSVRAPDSHESSRAHGASAPCSPLAGPVDGPGVDAAALERSAPPHRGLVGPASQARPSPRRVLVFRSGVGGPVGLVSGLLCPVGPGLPVEPPVLVDQVDPLRRSPVVPGGRVHG